LLSSDERSAVAAWLKKKTNAKPDYKLALRHDVLWYV